MKKIQFIETTPQQLNELIADTVKKQLDSFLQNYKPKQSNEYLTKEQVSQLFGVHISTISNWQRNGTLNPFGLSGRVYFLRSEIEASLKPLNV